MPKIDRLVNDPQFIADIDGELSSRAVAEKWGIAKSTVNNYRSSGLPTRRISDTLTETRTESSDGSVVIEKKAFRIIPLSEWLDGMRRDGLNPDEYNTSHSHSVWTQHTKSEGTKTLYANRFSATKKTAKQLGEAAVDWAGASRFIEDFTYVPAKQEHLVDAAILQPTDEQWGKTDFAGGTPQTEERVMTSYAGFVDYIREYRPRQVLIARTGDGIENACSTNNQRDTNDLDLPAMLAQSFKMDLASLKMIAPHAQEIVNAYVPSNHGRWRTGLKADAGNPHADFGIAVARQIQSTQDILGSFPNVRTVVPDALMESMTVELDTVNIGLVHGHQVGNPDRIGDWWAKQDHGRMPTWLADILLVGHFHSLRIQQSGDARWIVVGPASDNGSSWFSNLKGERATAGMLALTIEGKRYRHQEIL